MKHPNIDSILEILQNNKLASMENIKWIKDHPDSETLITALNKLNKVNLLNNEYINFIKQYSNLIPLIVLTLNLLEDNNLLKEWYVIRKMMSIKSFSKMLLSINKLGGSKLLTREYIKFTLKHNYPEEMALGLNSLDVNGLLEEKYIEWIQRHAKPDKMAWALSLLNQSGLLNEEKYIEWTLLHSDPQKMARGLNTLNQSGLLNEEKYIKYILHHSDPDEMAKGLNTLNQNKILNEENIKFIYEYIHSDNINYTLDTLDIPNQHRRLNQENKKWICKYYDPEKIAKALNTLKQNRLLNKENIALIINYPYLINIAKEISILADLHLLNQGNFNKLLNPDYYILFGNDRRIVFLIDKIPSHVFSQTVFDQLIEYSQRPNPVQEIEAYVDRLLRLNPDNTINHDQSVHTSSIEKSASDSAVRLNHRYGEKISGDKLNPIILEIQEFISLLPDTSQINLAAKRCIERITQPDYTFKDPASKITIRQLLALTYLALKDRELCTATQKDATSLFIKGLYEIQRGYNINERDIDDEKTDKPICISGTFNKLLDKLSGIHKDVELIFVTKELAAVKLPKVVLEETHKYLQERSSPKSASDFKKVVCLMKDIQNKGVEVIWSEIEPEVRNHLFDEFESLYKDKDSPNFNMLIDNGIYTPLEDLSRYQKNLISSPGYQQYCSHMIKNSSRFFQSREDANDHDTENHTKYGYRIEN